MTILLKLTVLLGMVFSLHNPAFAERKASQVNPLMACLGNEELNLHRARSMGPAYFLNQHFIKELSTLYGLSLKKKVLDEVCQSREFSPSVNLLRVLLLRGTKAFELKKFNEDGPQALAKSSLENFLDTLPQVFYAYLARLQALAPTAGCLEKEIPEIAYFMERSKYLEDIMGADTLLQNPKKIEAVFKGLKNFDAVLKRCKPKKK